MQPIVNGLEAEYGDQMAFDRRDATHPEGRAIMSIHGLRGHPSYLIINPEGELLWSLTGAVPEETLRAHIAQYTTKTN